MIKINVMISNLNESHNCLLTLRNNKKIKKTSKKMNSTPASVDPIFMQNETVPNSGYQYKYNGKEWQDELGLNFYDYGARNYDPAIGRWMNVDPLAADAPGWTPYNAMWNNPLRFVDPDGRWAVVHVDVTKNDDGTFTVLGGEANADKNIYVVNGSGQRTGEVVGEMLTEYSFHDNDGKAVVGAVINPNDNSGQEFMDNEIIKANPGLLGYMINATDGEKYDFKTRGINERPEGMNRTQYS
jgi:RHS repeat-associated protein